MAIRVADHLTQMFNILSKTRRHAFRGPLTHSALHHSQRESTA